MAFSQYGSTAYVFGLNDVTIANLASAIGIRPTEIKITQEPEFDATAQNENGETASVVKGPNKLGLTMNGFLVEESLFNSGGNFNLVINGQTRFFIIDQKNLGKSNKDFQKADISATSFALVTF